MSNLPDPDVTNQGLTILPTDRHDLSSEAVVFRVVGTVVAIGAMVIVWAWVR